MVPSSKSHSSPPGINVRIPSPRITQTVTVMPNKIKNAAVVGFIPVFPKVCPKVRPILALC